MTDTTTFIETDWKVVNKEGTLLKIISFPCDYADFGGESMWVRVIHGTDTDGIGYVCNDPAFSSLRYGDVIAYAGGTDDTKAHYAGLANNVFEYEGSPQRQYLTEMAQGKPEVQQFYEAASQGCASCGEGAHECE